MKKLIVPAILGIAILNSCEKKQNESVVTENATKTEQVAENHDEHATQDEHSAESTKLELDNGKKWKTNAEMLPFIKEQEKLLENFDDDKDDYKVLAAHLSSANEKLIKSCTMTGKPHDALHVWLTDHMKNIDLLAKAPNKQEAEKTIDVLEHSMETYHTFFE